jgi:hypothetical protein
MPHPAFFAQVSPLIVHDALAEALGAAEAGIVEYRYLDAVRLAGHSCPTVAGAWLLCRQALAALYPDSPPERGGLRVELHAAQDSGNTGVVGAVIGLITGAAGAGGFQGLAGRHVRRGLLAFGVEMRGDVRITRLDNAACAELAYHPEVVPAEVTMPPLMTRVLSGAATPMEGAEFGRLWQERVRRILLEGDRLPGLVTRFDCDYLR